MKVSEYFISGKMPERMSSCPGKPLPADGVAAAIAANRGLQGERVSASAVYKDPSLAQDIVRRIHSQIDRAARGAR